VSITGVALNATGTTATVTIKITCRDADGDVRLGTPGSISGLYVSPHPALRVSKLFAGTGSRD
jgi:hypothetical protein